MLEQNMSPKKTLLKLSGPGPDVGKSFTKRGLTTSWFEQMILWMI